MVKVKNLSGVPELQEPVGFLKLDAADNKWTCLVDGIAYDLRGSSSLLAVSVAGGSTEIRAWRAAFSTETKLALTWTEMGVGNALCLQKDPSGYNLFTAPLGMGAFHLVAVSKREDFLPSLSEEAVWQNLTKRTTTPLDREWMPALMAALTKRNLLTAATAHGRMQPGLLSINTEGLDKLVSEGLRHRNYKIVA